MFTIGNLSEKGISFYADTTTRYEIPQNAEVVLNGDEAIELYISARHLQDSEKRFGKIFVLKEEYQAIMVDLVKEYGNGAFRSYEAIDSFTIDADFDAWGFTRNLLASNINMEFFKVLEMLTMNLAGGIKSYDFCNKVNTFIQVPCGNSNVVSEPTWSPIGGWSQYNIDYSFFDDFFKDDSDELPSLWNQMWLDKKAYSVKANYYTTYGFDKNPSFLEPEEQKQYNYFNDIYPEHTELLDYRWREGGYDVSFHEKKAAKTFIFRTFKNWYKNGGLEKTKIPLVPISRSMEDMAFPIWKGDGYSKINGENSGYQLYDGAQSIKPGIGEIITSRHGYTAIDFGAATKVTGVKIRVGIHEYSEGCTPTNLYIRGSNDGDSWRTLKRQYDIDRYGEWTEIDIYGVYRYFSIVWYSSVSDSNVRVSDVQWLTSLSAYGKYNFIADEKTVRYFTDIAKTDLYHVVQDNEDILESVLGPRECAAGASQSSCSLWTYGEYGEVDPIVTEDGEWLLPEDIMMHVGGELPANRFLAIKDNGISSVKSIPDSVMNYFAAHNGVSPEDAFYAMEYFAGKIGGQYVFNGGIGNEYRYGMQFGSFLEEQGWTIDDFMEIYKDHIRVFMSQITNAMTTDTNIRPIDFCEFYDVNHRSPFDGIRVYIPKFIVMGGMTPEDAIINTEFPEIAVTKSKVVYNQDGSFTVEYSDRIILGKGDLGIEINKDEFVSSVFVKNALKVFVSDFTTIKATIRLKSSYNGVDSLKVRLLTSDYTYMQERYFDYAV